MFCGTNFDFKRNLQVCCVLWNVGNFPNSEKHASDNCLETDTTLRTTRFQFQVFRFRSLRNFVVGTLCGSVSFFGVNRTNRDRHFCQKTDHDYPAKQNNFWFLKQHVLYFGCFNFELLFIETLSFNRKTFNWKS
jgi:hypothetical protein